MAMNGAVAECTGYLCNLVASASDSIVCSAGSLVKGSGIELRAPRIELQGSFDKVSATLRLLRYCFVENIKCDAPYAIVSFRRSLLLVCHCVFLLFFHRSHLSYALHASQRGLNRSWLKRSRLAADQPRLGAVRL